VPEHGAWARCPSTVHEHGARARCLSTVPEHGAWARCPSTVPEHDARVWFSLGTNVNGPLFSKQSHQNRPYSYSRYWTGTSLQPRPMRGVFSNANEVFFFIIFIFFLMIFPRISLNATVFCAGTQTPVLGHQLWTQPKCFVLFFFPTISQLRAWFQPIPMRSVILQISASFLSWQLNFHNMTFLPFSLITVSCIVRFLSTIFQNLRVGFKWQVCKIKQINS